MIFIHSQSVLLLAEFTKLFAKLVAIEEIYFTIMDISYFFFFFKSRKYLEYIQNLN
jgi:hypothetical protein